MSRSRRRRHGQHREPRRAPDLIRARRVRDERLEAERRAQHEFARIEMQIEAEIDFQLPAMLGEPEPLL